MNYRLHLRLEQLERATEKLLHAAARFGGRAHAAPAPGQWSAAQVVHHLFVTETAIIGQVEKKLREAGLGQPSWADSLRALLIRVVFRLPGIRVRAPRGVGELTESVAVPALAELQNEWQATRRRLEQLLNEFPPTLLRRAVFRHPRSGLMTITQTLDFMLDHVLHHQQQLRRIAKTVKISEQ